MIKSQSKENVPSVNDFYVNTGLYTEFKLNKHSAGARSIMYTSETIDCFCIKCGKHSIFNPVDNRPMGGGDLGLKELLPVAEVIPIFVEKKFTCSRNSLHKIIYYIKVEGGSISKIGQHPSLAEIAEKDIKQYRKILGEHYNDYSKAIGLYAHGIGVGSFVYLRRIIENFLMKSAHEKAKSKDDWNEPEYHTARVKDKIQLLKDYLPEDLVNNPSVYSIVSKGIHELTEDECKQYFPAVRSCLELIFTELEAISAKKQKRKEMQSEINKIAGKI